MAAPFLLTMPYVNSHSDGSTTYEDGWSVLGIVEAAKSRKGKWYTRVKTGGDWECHEDCIKDSEYKDYHGPLLTSLLSLILTQIEDYDKEYFYELTKNYAINIKKFKAIGLKDEKFDFQGGFFLKDALKLTMPEIELFLKPIGGSLRIW